MQKFTIIVAILSVSIVAIVAEVLLHGYSFSENQMQANVLQVNGKKYQIEDLLFNGKASEEADSTLISEDDLRSAGLYDHFLKKVDFDGYLFGFLDLSDLPDLEVKKLQMIDGSLNIPTIVGAIYEISFEEESLSNEMFSIIKDRAAKKENCDINEINKQGDASFFINDDLRIGTAFLVVKSRKKVYAFTYPKVKHGNLKKLIDKLHGKENSNSS